MNCPRCGGPMIYDPEDRVHRCKYCEAVEKQQTGYHERHVYHHDEARVLREKNRQESREAEQEEKNFPWGLVILTAFAGFMLLAWIFYSKSNGYI